MKLDIENKYEKLAIKLGINLGHGSEGANIIIKELLRDFTDSCNNPAIWCMGEHTKMMMADFVYELKKIRYIIDKKIKENDMGVKIISESDILASGIDGIIISSYDYKEEIKETIKERFPQIKYLDIYEKMQDRGVIFQTGYYIATHPYSRYTIINQLQMELEKEKGLENRLNLYRHIIKEYVSIKDFKTAGKFAHELAHISNVADDRTFCIEIDEIYQNQKQLIESISENNVVMLCVDGLMRKDVLSEGMPRFSKWIKESTYFYQNAYSSSTSTYESLIPTYSENNNLKTGYYKKNFIDVNKCSFIMEALGQKRNIYFYTDSADYVKCDKIKMNECFQTATEKLWDFMIDSYDDNNGLFYIHMLYESHFSYPNPYTMKKIIAEGTYILFDFYENRGGKLRTDYIAQKRDALRYLDDVTMPLLEVLKCRMVIFADHGSLILHPKENPGTMDKLKLTFHDDLIQIPLAIKSPEMMVGIDNKMISLMELSTIICCLLSKKNFVYREKPYIKVVRSQIYNPDFIRLYRRYKCEKALRAFEMFKFVDGYKLAVYADGEIEIYLDDKRINDKTLCRKYYRIIKKEITVLDLKDIIYSRIVFSHLFNTLLRQSFEVAKKVRHFLPL